MSNVSEMPQDHNKGASIHSVQSAPSRKFEHGYLIDLQSRGGKRGRVRQWICDNYLLNRACIYTNESVVWFAVIRSATTDIFWPTHHSGSAAEAIYRNRGYVAGERARLEVHHQTQLAMDFIFKEYEGPRRLRFLATQVLFERACAAINVSKADLRELVAKLLGMTEDEAWEHAYDAGLVARWEENHAKQKRSYKKHTARKKTEQDERHALGLTMMDWQRWKGAGKPEVEEWKRMMAARRAA